MLPIEAAQQAAEEEYNIQSGNLREKENQLRDAQIRLKALQQDFDSALRKKDDLEQKIDICSHRLRRASHLGVSLNSEKTAWLSRAREIDESLLNIRGNSLLCAAVIVYLGPFDETYRSRILPRWVEKVGQRGIRADGHFSLLKSLGDPMQVMSW